MIITKTPFRVSFFGGGCDLPGYFVNKESLILSTTIDKYAYVNVRHLPKFFDYSNEIVYSKIEQVKNESEIIHPLVRRCMEMLDMHEMRVCYDADLPARTGRRHFSGCNCHHIIYMYYKPFRCHTFSPPVSG